jgi:hypothetical protein
MEVIFGKVDGATVFGNEGVDVANLATWLVKLKPRTAG